MTAPAPAPAKGVRQLHEEKVAARFASEVAGHEMSVLHDDGLYRHIRFARPSSAFDRFELVTWPSHLAINSSWGNFMFARPNHSSDLLRFFANGPDINPGYWTQSISGGQGTGQFSEDVFREMVSDHVADHAHDYPGIVDAVQERVFDCLWSPGDHSPPVREAHARELLHSFAYTPISDPRWTFNFLDTGEWDFSLFYDSYLWCCHALRSGSRAFLATKDTR